MATHKQQSGTKLDVRWLHDGWRVGTAFLLGIIAIPGTGKATASEIKNYMARHIPTTAGMLERVTRRLALVARQQDDVRPANHPEVKAWVERNWPEFSSDARALLADLRRLPVVLVERASKSVPGVDADVTARVWRAAVDAIMAK